MTGSEYSRRDFLKLLGSGAVVLGLGVFGIGSLRNSTPQQQQNKNRQIASAQSGPGSWQVVNDGVTNPLLQNDPVMAGLLRDGKIFYMSGSGFYHPNFLGPWTVAVWDPATATDNQTVMDEDLFCGGCCTLPNGNILIAGGTLEYDDYSINGHFFGLKSAYEVDFITGEVGNRTEMAHGRWYPTCVELADGKVFVLRGVDEFGCSNQLPEIYDPVARTWTIKLDPSRSSKYTPGGLITQGGCYKPDDVIPPGGGQITYGGVGIGGVLPGMYLYSRAHLMPNGLVAVVGQNKFYYLWDPSNGKLFTLPEVPKRYYGTSILLPLENTLDEQGKVLVCCGSNCPVPEPQNNCTGLAVNDAEIVEPGANFTLNRRAVAPMTAGRRHPSPVLLPTGKVIIVGGNTFINDEPSKIMFPEEFDPETETWTVLPSMSIRRLYHSVALLMLDGRIWVAGTTIGENTKDLTSEIFSPWYVSETRPTIVGDPTVGGYGGTITIPTPEGADIDKVSLVKQSSLTHHYNTDQRLIWLPIVSQDPLSVTVSAPINSRLAPPGMYLLHVLNSAGVPSVGKFVQIPGALPPDIIPPEVAITSPEDGATITGASTGVVINIAGTASDNLGGNGIEKVEVQIDGNPFVTATPASFEDWSTWSASVTATTEGSHTITARATDKSGNFADAMISITAAFGFTSIYQVTGSAGSNSYLKLYAGGVKRAGEIVLSTSVLKGQPVKRVSVVLRKFGNPTGTISVVVRKSSGDSVVLTFGTIDASTLTTTDQTFTFTAPSSRVLAANDRVLVEWAGIAGATGKQVWVKRLLPPDVGFDTNKTKLAWMPNNGVYTSHNDHDLAGEWFKDG